MARLQTIENKYMTERQKQIHDEIVSGPRGQVRGPLAIWLYRPELADRAQSLGQYCRYDTSLEPRLSELAILTTARIWDAAFEWQAHVPHALAGGVDSSIIDSLSADQTPSFVSKDEEIVYAVTREINITRQLSDDTYNQVVKILGVEATVDLIGLLGYYALISMTINAFKIPSIEDKS
ncbi:MAG: carboxymuconolactone decarboxylase family protein [Alphaproteobacteria bacterium]|nr:carboxymuconolactone decarboxylase family protein [Alphaproteobacteria bacterium]